MPQQICSLCCDKINDFYEFREMCAATNEQTRKLLRLPEQLKPTPIIKRVISTPADAIYDNDDEGVESIFGVLGGEEAEVKFDSRSSLAKKAKKGSATTSKKAARVAARAVTKGKIKREITVFSDDGSDAAYSIIISDDDLDSVPKKRPQKRKAKDTNNLTLLLAPKELNQREREREAEQKKKTK